MCQAHQAKQSKEPMIARKIPDLPWTELASDLLYFDGEHYLLTVDYYSKYIEVSKIPDVTSHAAIEALKDHFATHGIPERLTTDNGTHYASKEFTEFAKDYNFEHVTISPHHSKSNGESEAAVKTVKGMWSKCKDKQLALLNYRATPLPDIGLSPSQLLMSRRLRTRLPTARGLLKPKENNQEEVARKLKQSKDKQKSNYDKHASKELPPLIKGDMVRVSPQKDSKEWKLAKVVGLHNTPRSYVVDTGTRNLRRNRVMLRKTAEPQYSSTATQDSYVPVDEPLSKTLVSDVSSTPVEGQHLQQHQPAKEHTAKLQETAKPKEVKQQETTKQPYVTTRGRTVKKPNKLNL